MHPTVRSLSLATLLLWAPSGFAQTPGPKYLTPTEHYLVAAKLDLSALPAPPQPGSLAAQADLEAILELQVWRNDAELAWVKKIDRFDAFDAGAAIGPWFTRANLPKCAKLLQEALGDGEAANHVAKLKYKRLRPPYSDPRVHPALPLTQPKGEPKAGYYSYPSGHATSLFLIGELLADLVPERREEVLAWAAKASWSRMLAGVHFPSDHVGGHILAQAVVKGLKANPEFQAAWKECEAEVRAAKTSSSPS